MMRSEMASRLFIDLDGVLADFDRYHAACFGWRPDKNREPDWDEIDRHGSFYRDLPLMPDALELWAHVEPHSPTILTGIREDVRDCSQHKVDWVAKHLNTDRIITCLSKDKSLYARPGDVIVDDWEKYKHLWEEKGGIWVTHRSARESSERLEEMGWSRAGFFS